MSGNEHQHIPAPGGGRSDQDLVVAARAGERDAFGVLWARHAQAGLRFAAATTRSFDADDLVAEAYVKIYAAVLAGSGPTGPFRPYLLVTIRNLAISWARQRREGPLDEAEDIPDPRATDARALAAVDANLTVRAFRTLPERWQEVLWFLEVDGLSSADVATRLDMTVQGVGMLALRAREGLRQAWIQAHIDTSSVGSEHRWALQHVGQNVRGKLRTRAKRKFDAHLGECAACTVIAAEAVDTSNRFTPALVPLAVGVFGVAGLGEFLHAPDAAQAATVREPASLSKQGATGWRLPRGRVFLVAGAVVVVAVMGAVVGQAVTTRHAELAGPSSTPSVVTAPSAAAEPTVTPPPAYFPATATPSASSARSGSASPTDVSSAAPTPPSPPPTSTSEIPSSPTVQPPTIRSVDTGHDALYPTVTGTARPGADVTVTAIGITPVTVVADDTGTWTVPELRTRNGASSITATADGRSSTPAIAQLTSPQLFVAISDATITVTIQGVSSTSYTVQVDGADPKTVRTDSTGAATVTVANTLPGQAQTVTAAATAGARTGPTTTVRSSS